MTARIIGLIETSGEIGVDGSGLTIARLSAIIDGRETELIGIVSHPEPFRFNVMEKFGDDAPVSFRFYPDLEQEFRRIMLPVIPSILAVSVR